MRRTVVVTGASSGIGLAAACELARRGDDVLLVGRHPDRLRRAVERVAAETLRRPRSYRADFASLADVRQLADRIRADTDHIDVLVNNAGTLGGWGWATVDGYHATLQVNHLAGFLLAHLLHDHLTRAAARRWSPARLVTTGSLAEAWGWLAVDRPAAPLLRYRSRWLAYGASKQANLLFTIEAGRRWQADGIVATCFFPGLVRSRFATSSPSFLLAKPVMVSPRLGADTLVWLATADEALVPGGYFALRSPFVGSPWGTNPRRAERLWESSLTAAGLR